MLYPVTIASTPIKEKSQVATARQRGLRLARQLGFDETAQGRVALVVSEAATNVLVHANGGEILMSASELDGQGQLQVLVTDRGPGIVRLGQALAGGSSSGDGLGEGLGAIRRLSNQFEIYAPPGGGTTICSRIAADRTLPTEWPEGPEIGAVIRPKRGERQCGDAWAYRPLSGNSGLTLVVDGVGHGPAAAEAADRAIQTLAEFRRPDVVALMEKLHRNLSGSRGAAALAVFLDPASSTLTACGVGNISATLSVGSERRGIVSLNGTLGHGELRLQDFSYEWPEGALLLVHSDGISTRWDLRDYPGLRLRHPTLIGGVLYRDHGYDRDDATALVIRRTRWASP